MLVLNIIVLIYLTLNCYNLRIILNLTSKSTWVMHIVYSWVDRTSDEPTVDLSFYADIFAQCCRLLNGKVQGFWLSVDVCSLFLCCCINLCIYFI